MRSKLKFPFGSHYSTFNHKTEVSMKNSTNRDQVRFIIISIVGLAVIVATLVYEDMRASLDNGAWYHTVIMFIGLMLVAIAMARFLSVIAMLAIPGGYDQEDLRILRGQGWLFRSQVHFFNWIALLLLGVFLIILELKWEQDWLRSSGLS